MIQAARALGAITAVSTLLAPVSAIGQTQDIYRIRQGTFGAHVEYHTVELGPGKELVLADIKGPGKVTYFYYTDNGHEHPGDGDGILFPGLVLRVYWDDAEYASIQVPLWDFFGAMGREALDYQSAAMQINHYCNMSYLPMPFSDRARFVLANDSDRTYSRSVAWGIDYEADQAFASEPSRLHVAWRRSNPTVDAKHRILEVSGRGQYIGNFLQVNTNYQGWWGEGDTDFEIDGRSVKHSPGTEDEYGSTWGFGHTYSYMFSGYLQMNGGKNRMYRWYLVNPVRFQKSLKVDIQDQRYEGGQIPSKDDFTSVAFWYQQGASPSPALPSYEERIAPSKGAQYSSNKPVTR